MSRSGGFCEEVSGLRVIGLGTGRCGTHTLAEILSQQGFDSEHERFEHLRWEFSPWPDFHLSRASGPRPWADTGFYYLPYVELLLNDYPKTKFICMERNRADVIDSFLRHMPPECDWFREDGPYDHWFHSFPTFPSMYTPQQAIGAYWDLYSEAAARLSHSYPESFLTANVSLLNSWDGIASILEWLGIPNHKAIIKPGLVRDSKSGLGQ
jgi:hypothetical protein